jgi:O-antigen ligase
MPNQTIVIALISFIVLAFTQKMRQLARIDRSPTQLHGRNIIFASTIVVILNNIPNFFLVVRDTPYELVIGELSTSNILQIVSTILVAIYCNLIVMANGNLRSNLLAGPFFWIMVLLALYCVSTLWSIFPKGTAFGSIELVAYFAVAVFIFSGKRPLINLYWIMFFQILLGALALAQGGIVQLQSGRFFGFLQSNQHALYAAVYLLLHYHLYRSRILGYIFGLVMFVGFGSSATTSALLSGIAVYLIYGNTTSILYLARTPIITAIVIFNFSFIFFPEYFGGAIDVLSTVLQKDPEHFYDATGRLNIWPNYLEILKDYPLGTGFWSEREFLYEHLSSFAQHHWFLPPNTHNGYLSAYLSAGIPAVLCLSLVYISTIKHLGRQPSPIRRIGLSMLMILFINSLTYPGIGGYFTLWYYVLVAIIALSNLRIASTRPAEPVLHAGSIGRLPGTLTQPWRRTFTAR